MSHDKSAVRKILDQAKAAGRESLTVPEARGVCDAYGINIPKEGLARSEEEAAEYLYQHGIPAYAYSTGIPVAVLGAKYKWARGAGLIPGI
jgi:acyl-CoA synthetase (NDP forming)